MKELEQIISAAREAIAATSSIADLEQVKARFLGKAGSLNAPIAEIKTSAVKRP